MNKIFLIGNLTKDPIINTTKSGMKTAQISLAINEGKDKEGNNTVIYYNCTAFDKQAQLMENYVKKGHKIMIAGRGKNESYDNKEGIKVNTFKVIISEIELCYYQND
jgi:single-strand DNA-binding protein